MARYDLPTYVIYVSGHFWMFAVKITECVLSLKSLGLLTPPTQSLGQSPKKRYCFYHLLFMYTDELISLSICLPNLKPICNLDMSSV